MKIDELIPAQPISVLVTMNSEQIEFATSVQEIISRRNAIIASPILRNDKIIAFRGNHILTHLVATFEDGKPHIFYNVAIQNLKRPGGELCHEISTVALSREFNRRETYRCFIGSGTHVQVGVNCVAIDATIKDVSVNGFSFIVPKQRDYSEGSVVHTILTDFIDELNQQFSFHLFGIIVRNQELENGNIVYGCRLNTPVPGLEKYIMTKERIRLQKSRGRN